MEKIIKKFITEYMSKNKRRFELFELESYLINHHKGNQNYLSEGGYCELYRQIVNLKNNNYIKEIHSSKYNGLNPPLKTKWQIVLREETPRWDQSKILRYSDLLDFSYYMNNPSYQTESEWEYIKNVYNFLKNRDEREWASVEERSLELFYDEKFLADRKDAEKGKYGILTRLRLSYEDLKMKKYGEMFIYWNKGIKEIRNIIILENHSIFFTYKRIAEPYGTIFGFPPDILVYGEGKKIENSLSFIEEIADISKVKILYFGDFDPEGLGIYFRLKERYPNLNIQLQDRAYALLIQLCNRDYKAEEQKKNQKYFDSFLQEINDYLTEQDLKKLKFIWDNDLRIPQELITYEILMKVKSCL